MFWKLAFLASALIAIILGTLVVVGVDPNPLSKVHRTLVCDLPLYNPLGGDVRIDKGNIDCYSTKSAFCFGQMSLTGWILGTDKGTINMHVDGRGVSKNYEIAEFTGRPDSYGYMLKMSCLQTGNKEIVFRVYDDNGMVVDSTLHQMYI